MREVRPLDSNGYTPENERLEPENHLIEKENHLPNLQFLGSMLICGGLQVQELSVF